MVASRLSARFGSEIFLAARDATDEELLGAHTPEYLELVKRECASVGRAHYLSTGDVVVDDSTLAVARRAAGGAIVAMEHAVEMRKPTFALVRPPGHHAEAKAGMGFCLFNNAAIAARSFLQKNDGRVLVVDFDYHHGNGTQDIAGNGLSYVSTHARPAYPGTGAQSFTLPGSNEIVNVPLPASGISTEAFIATWEQRLPAIARRVKPTMLVISAGFDYVKGDPVGDLGVDVEAATHLASVINATAAEHNADIAYVLEGGYDIDALTESIAQIVEASDTGRTERSGASQSARGR
ncbi:MAG: histone deacetylase [Candidatus Eremiobacteraeota bacterium]|nr:histone deacetylase [Candidatus Eremiobacteraeota bacterium]